VSEYLEKERSGAKLSEPLFVVRYRWTGGELKERRMAAHRVWKLVKALGKRSGVSRASPARVQAQLRR
jgi:hypothetical protein